MSFVGPGCDDVEEATPPEQPDFNAILTQEDVDEAEKLSNITKNSENDTTVTNIKK